MKISKILLTGMGMDAEKYMSRKPRHHGEGSLIVNVNEQGKCWAVYREGDEFIQMNIKNQEELKEMVSVAKHAFFNSSSYLEMVRLGHCGSHTPKLESSDLFFEAIASQVSDTPFIADLQAPETSLIAYKEAQQFKVLLAELDKKRISLLVDSPDCKGPAMDKLYKTLDSEFQKVKDGVKNPAEIIEFKKKCSEAIEKASPILEVHRDSGLKRIFREAIDTISQWFHSLRSAKPGEKNPYTIQTESMSITNKINTTLNEPRPDKPEEGSEKSNSMGLR